MNLASKTLTGAVAVLVAGLLSNSALAGGGGCDRCGHDDACRVARLVKTEKKIEVTCFTCEDDAVVLPGRSCRGEKQCTVACDGGCAGGLLAGHGNGKGSCGSKGTKGKGGGCDDGLLENLLSPTKKHVWYDWTPGCASVKTRRKLMRSTVVKSVPGYDWIVEDVCKGCDGKSPAADIMPGADVPPPPTVDAQLRYGNPFNLPVSFKASAQRAKLRNLSDRFVRSVK